MSRLTQAEMRLVAALRDKRDRDRLALYVAEGDKLVREALALGLAVESIYAEADWIRCLPAPAESGPRIVQVSPAELRRLSAQKTPNGVLAVLKKPQPVYEWSVPPTPLLVLETIQDPGNVGSLLRVAAWFGIPDVVMSPDCADPFSPKVVQGSMGAIFRVRAYSLPIVPFVAEARRRGLPVVAAALGGDCLYDAGLASGSMLLFGNESSGLSQELLGLASQRLAIPAWHGTGPGCDSLNVAAAAAVFCSELRRRAASDGHATGPK